MALFLLAGIGLQLIGPQVARSFIDAARSGAAEQILVRTALFFIVVTVLQLSMRVLASYWSERVAWGATNALRADLIAHLLRLDISFFKARTPGELIERVDGDVNTLAGFFSSLVVELAGNIILILGIIVAVTLVDLRLGLSFMAFALLSVLLLQWIRRFGVEHWQAERECNASFYGYLGEVLSATEDLRSSGAVPYAMQRFFGYRRVWLPVGIRADLWGNAIWMTAVGLFALSDALAFGLGGLFYRSNDISLGSVYLLVAYNAMLIVPIEAIRTRLQDLQQADAVIVRIYELLETRSQLADGDQAIPDGPLSVEFRDLRFAYDYQHVPEHGNGGGFVFDKLSFKLEAGRTLGLLGHTGSGKTTIGRLIFRFYDPQAGAVRIGGVDLREARLSSLRHRVGLVTQDVQIFEASLRDNLTFFNPAIADQQLLSVLDTLHLTPWLKRLPNGLNTMISASQLSAGEAQLIALARVFLKNPGLVILDEASSRLDPATEALLEKALSKLLEGRTTIIIAHRLATVERADEILILDHGTILEYGARATLARDPRSKFAELRRTGLGEVLL
jgi:ATP-binding cassette, subfamily B, bacterial